MRASQSLIVLFLSSIVCTYSAADTSHYVGQESRAIKALSPSEIEGFLQGRGMGLARPAELNGYPGPMHVLELGDKLGLSEEQAAATKALYARMRGSAMKLGAELVAAEKALDELFRDRRANEGALVEQLSRIGDLQAKLRGVHLSAHIEQTKILSPHQIAKYAELRGYVGNLGHHHGGHNGHKH